MKKSFAILALQFPPVGGGYSERMAGFAKFWCRRPDLNLHVICGKPDGLDTPIDESLLDDITDAASITRLSTLRGRLNFGLFARYRFLNFAGKVVCKLIPIDVHLPWSLAAANKASQLYRNGEISCVLTSSTPYSVHVAGLLLKRRHPDIRWIADFRDPWTTNYQRRFKRWVPFASYVQRKLEQAIYDRADAVIINTHQNLEDLDAVFQIDRQKTHVIQNGFDPEVDFSVTATEKKPKDRFRLGYIGGFRGDWFEGPFLEALKTLKTDRPDLYLRLEVPLVGTHALKGNLHSILGITDRLNCKGFFPRMELGKWVAGFDALVLVLPDNDGALLGWVPQRLYFYLATGLPILCIAPNGEAARYIRATEHGIVVHPKDVSRIAEIIASWVIDPPLKKEAYADSVKEFSKELLADRLLNIVLRNEET